MKTYSFVVNHDKISFKSFKDFIIIKYEYILFNFNIKLVIK